MCGRSSSTPPVLRSIQQPRRPIDNKYKHIMNEGIGLAVAGRDVSATREIMDRILHDVQNLKVSFPKALSTTQLDDAASLVEVSTELVSTCKAAAVSPRHKATGKGEFKVLFVTPSAPRAASLCGVLARGGLVAAKLFGKHMTVEEQTEFLQSHLVDVAVGTPARLAKLAASSALSLEALRYIIIDVQTDDKDMHFFSSAKGGARRPDAEDLASMLKSSAFQAALTTGEKRALTVCPVLLPPKAALEASTPIGQRMDNAARGRGKGGGRGRGGKGGSAGGKGGGRGIHKRPKASAFAMRAHKKGSG